jgi:hypothetical protein
MTDTKRRVKLYALNADRQWDDRGTGHVSSSYVDRLKGMSLLVKAESDGSLLLESKILADTAYQKQQETLIVWSEADNYDLALSFQEKAGCDEIWAKICQVQGKDPSVDITQEIAEEEDERFDDNNDTGNGKSRPLLTFTYLYLTSKSGQTINFLSISRINNTFIRFYFQFTQTSDNFLSFSLFLFNTFPNYFN